MADRNITSVFKHTPEEPVWIFSGFVATQHLRRSGNMFKIAGGQLLNISWLEYVDLFAVGVSAGKWGQWTWCSRPVQPYRTFN